ncbi:TonB-dependent siderophore receptor [Sphingomonas kyungheensis]|uniref:TonB-dependent siderophore receptor n=1 Tax=Sphingomonas kyungheensis TaxID=1069987 RepID=A0ABU8GZ16_9SPHN
MRSTLLLAGAALAALIPSSIRAETGQHHADAAAQQSTPAGDQREASDDILVEGRRDDTYAGTKTATPILQVPQPLTVITDGLYRAQGAINIADTVRYAAGVSAGSYGRDTRVDSFKIRGVDALQFRDGMRDIAAVYASITADPYNFSRVEIVRGPASVLFGQGAIGGIINLVSKTPNFADAGEVGVTYGSYGRKEVLADLNGVAGSTVAGRIVARVREAGTYVAHVPDDRVLLAPSLTWRPSSRSEVTLIGLYQKDDSGSTSNFLPIVGTLRANRDNPPLPRYLFLGKPGYDRYAGRLLQGGAAVTHHVSDAVTLSLKARYIDSHLDYFTHYTNSYSNPADPYLPGSNGRRIGLYASSVVARMAVFSTDNTLQARFHTGEAIEHRLLAGVDYSWNRVGKSSNLARQVIDLYAIDRAAIIEPPLVAPFSRSEQTQLGLYLQDQIRLWNRISVVLGTRHDRVRGATLQRASGETERTRDTATTYRAGIIGELAAGISPFLSYTESFQPIAGETSSGAAFKPQTGTQYETGVKWQPEPATLVTVTAFRIRERNRPVADPANPLGQIQAGALTTRGFEVEATRSLPGRTELTLAYGHNHLTGDSVASGWAAEDVASAWGSKTFVGQLADLRLGVGIRYLGEQVSSSPVWTIVTPGRTMIDALAELERDRWRLSLNATNLLDKRVFAICLARGDCFNTAPRNVMLSLGYRF